MAKPPKDDTPAGRDARQRKSGLAPRPLSEPSPRRNGARAVGSLLPDVGGVAFRRFGFVQGALLGRWREIVGPVYARWSVPDSLRFPRGQKTEGTLTIRVEGPFSVQLQHVAPQIIERVNRILGHNAVARLKLVQGRVPLPAVRQQPADARLAPGAQSEELAPIGNLVGVKDDGLRAALEDLAAQIAIAKGPPKIG
ncbi:MAG: DUF721 domain-containing protein [Sandarakinorhabdus sp.]|nr:DUF721 domain-containing protein [Sandarakinorhabdus sp.]MBS3960596.1 DUF721 domain-containing protein [Sandarakinorhabdus sp.]